MVRYKCGLQTIHAWMALQLQYDKQTKNDDLKLGPAIPKRHK